ncbi:uncharacterized protein LOC144491246, partial [Mustelus asterias]
MNANTADPEGDTAGGSAHTAASYPDVAMDDGCLRSQAERPAPGEPPPLASSPPTAETPVPSCAEGQGEEAAADADALYLGSDGADCSRPGDGAHTPAPEDEGSEKDLSDSGSAGNATEDSGDFPGTPAFPGGSLEPGDLQGPGPPPAPSQRNEDVTADSWREHRKHVFVLSEAGKPIYSRYGNEEALSSTMGVMMALVSFVQDGDNVIRSIQSGRGIAMVT